MQNSLNDKAKNQCLILISADYLELAHSFFIVCSKDGHVPMGIGKPSRKASDMKRADSSIYRQGDIAGQGIRFHHCISHSEMIQSSPACTNHI
jgi:hypothetical protein